MTEENFLKAIRHDPDNVSKYMQLCQYYAKAGDVIKLSQLLDAIIPRFYFVWDFVRLRSKVYIQQKEWNKAMLDLKKCIELKPEDAESYDSIGVIFQINNHCDRAIDFHKKALALSPNHIGYMFNYAVANDKAGRPNIAKTIYQEILDSSPKHCNAMVNLAIIFKNTKEFDGAEKLLKQAVELSPDLFPALMELGAVAKQKGDTEQAIKWYKKAKKVNPDNKIVGFVLDSLEGKTPEKPPEEYIADLFDSFSQDFDKKLTGELDYKVPDYIFDVLKPYISGKKKKVLDLGAGTGLLAKKLKRYSSYILGVDLSQKMLDKAQEQKLYNEVICGELLSHMKLMESASFDIITAADVFVYIGDLKEIFKEAKRLLKPKGVFSFSVEQNDIDANDFVIKDTARYGHTDNYIRALADLSKFKEIEFLDKELRQNKDKPIKGYICLYQNI